MSNDLMDPVESVAMSPDGIRSKKLPTATVLGVAAVAVVLSAALVLGTERSEGRERMRKEGTA